MKLKYETKRLIVIAGILLIFFFLAQQQGFISRMTGTETYDLETARSWCSPGKSIWSKIIPTYLNETSAIIKYVVSTSKPPTYSFYEFCADGIICCRIEHTLGTLAGEVEYKKGLASWCLTQTDDGTQKYIVHDDFCEDHECEKDADCGSILFDAPNDCGNPFWEPSQIDVQGTCTNYKCVYDEPDSDECKDWQLFVQDYKWYIGAGIVLLLIIIVIASSRPRSTKRRRR